MNTMTTKMKMRRGMSAMTGALAVVLALGAAACGDKDKPASADAESSEDSKESDKKSADDKSKEKSKDEEKSAADSSEAPRPAPKGITVEVKDFQVFSPFSDKRSLLSATKDDDFSTRSKTHHHGVGVVLEATNNTGKMLRNAWFEGELRFVAAGETIRCSFDVDRIGGGYWAPKTTFLSYAPQLDNAPGPKKPDWRNESESLDESVWRPGERIRMIGRQDYCAAAALSDMKLEKVEGEIIVKALPRFIDRFESKFADPEYELALVDETVRIRNRQSGRLVSVPVSRDKQDKRDVYVVEMQAAAAVDAPIQKLTAVRLNRQIDTWGEASLVASAPVPLNLSPAVLGLQRVKLGASMVHAAGNLLIFAQDGKIQHLDMSRRGLNLLTVEREDVPATTPEVKFSADELTGQVSDITMEHFSDNTKLSKGKSSVAVSWKIKLDGSSIDGRLRADVDAATSAYDQAKSAADAAGEDDQAAAKAKATAAKAKLTAAQSKYKTASGRERGRLAKLFPCKDVQLVTNRGSRKPDNGKEATDACSALKSEDTVNVTMRYTLERYELPVALAFNLGRDRLEFAPVASATLTKQDAR